MCHAEIFTSDPFQGPRIVFDPLDPLFELLDPPFRIDDPSLEIVFVTVGHRQFAITRKTGGGEQPEQHEHRSRDPAEGGVCIGGLRLVVQGGFVFLRLAFPSREGGGTEVGCCIFQLLLDP